MQYTYMPLLNSMKRVAIVTGGSRGLGRVMALALVRAGYSVTITASAPSRELDDTVASAQRFSGETARILPLIADVTDPPSAERVVEATLDHFGGLHAVINNAGRGMRLVSEAFTTDPVPFWTVPPVAWAQIVNTNVNGPFLMTAAAVPHLLTQGEGRIVNISTSAQTMIRRGYAPYGPSKAALEAATRSWAADLDGSGVTANLLLPGGAADTDLLPSGPGKKGADGNLLNPEIMAAPAVWLCSPESAHMNGARIIARLWDSRLENDDALSAAAVAHVVGV